MENDNLMTPGDRPSAGSARRRPLVRVACATIGAALLASALGAAGVGRDDAPPADQTVLAGTPEPDGPIILGEPVLVASRSTAPAAAAPSPEAPAAVAPSTVSSLAGSPDAAAVSRKPQRSNAIGTSRQQPAPAPVALVPDAVGAAIADAVAAGIVPPAATAPAAVTAAPARATAAPAATPSRSAPERQPQAPQRTEREEPPAERVPVEVYGASIGDPPEVGESATTEVVVVEIDERGDPWAPVRECESHGNYRTNTGNGFYGAYQFTQSTWNWVADAIGRPELVGVRPHRAAPADQDRIAQALAFEVPGGGLHHWPHCGRRYGT